MVDNKIPNKAGKTTFSPNIPQLELWNKSRQINPITKRKIKKNGYIYNYLNKLYNEYISTICEKISIPSNLENDCIDRYLNP